MSSAVSPAVSSELAAERPKRLSIASILPVTESACACSSPDDRFYSRSTSATCLLSSITAIPRVELASTRFTCQSFPGLATTATAPELSVQIPDPDAGAPGGLTDPRSSPTSAASPVGRRSPPGVRALSSAASIARQSRALSPNERHSAAVTRTDEWRSDDAAVGVGGGAVRPGLHRLFSDASISSPGPTCALHGDVLSPGPCSVGSSSPTRRPVSPHATWRPASPLCVRPLCALSPTSLPSSLRRSGRVGSSSDLSNSMIGLPSAADVNVSDADAVKAVRDAIAPLLLPEGQLALLVERAERRVYPRYADVIREGAVGSASFVLLQGSLELRRSRHGVVKPVLITPGANGLIGESGLQTGQDGRPLTSLAREATAKVASDVAVLLLITRETLAGLEPDVAATLLRGIQQLYVAKLLRTVRPHPRARVSHRVLSATCPPRTVCVPSRTLRYPSRGLHAAGAFLLYVLGALPVT